MRQSAYSSSAQGTENFLVPSVNKNFPFPVNLSVAEVIAALLDKGGPDPEDYYYLDRYLKTLFSSVHSGLISFQEVEAAKQLFSEEFLSQTIHGYGYTKPMGYAGDFLMIDKIYTYHCSKNPEFEKWDAYFHHLEAAQAVRNRKDYFKKQLLKRIEHSSTTVHLLDVASGPCRDVLELYQQIMPAVLQTTCVDLDERAIAHAKDVCWPYLKQIEFYHQNILRFTPEKQFDVVWSAGLFDYFNDQIFVLAIKRLVKHLKPGGELIIGNFSEENSSRGYMELFGEWYLLHRSKEQLIQLALEAGIRRDKITVDYEPLGVNLFLKICQ
ncbi:class I SAM-dependent methyltransferase [Rhodocytophaga aerolata]|uniref:Class I SAM-dependent methyltransferase n=1 Tax=Rhodocytophaga aerolata TaxID=455078 RepID=A0ABT8RHM4_9BACT|nr:class I SAM-dependent methyltransferase [Rhodocytophaga aerolata]MDO1451607.1 class I SAM-dependent methyltransferase [Rhodocytophaga aerolata]